MLNLYRDTEIDSSSSSYTKACKKLRNNFHLPFGLVLTVLAGCSGGGSSNPSESNVNDPSVSSAIVVPPDVQAVETESIASVELAVIDSEQLASTGLTSTFYNTELGCPDGWQETTFEFDNETNTMSTVLCDGTSMSADFTVNGKAIHITNIALDGEETPNDIHEYWGLLPVEGSNDQWRACYFSYVSDEEDTITNQQSMPVNALIPPAEVVSFDCSEDVFIFYDQQFSSSFVAQASKEL